MVYVLEGLQNAVACWALKQRLELMRRLRAGERGSGELGGIGAPATGVIEHVGAARTQRCCCRCRALRASAGCASDGCRRARARAGTECTHCTECTHWAHVTMATDNIASHEIDMYICTYFININLSAYSYAYGYRRVGHILIEKLVPYLVVNSQAAILANSIHREIGQLFGHNLSAKKN